MCLFGGCGNNGGSNDSWIWILIIIVLIFCCSDGLFGGNSNSCGNICGSCCD